MEKQSLEGTSHIWIFADIEAAFDSVNWQESVVHDLTVGLCQAWHTAAWDAWLMLGATLMIALWSSNPGIRSASSSPIYGPFQCPKDSLVFHAVCLASRPRSYILFAVPLPPSGAGLGLPGSGDILGMSCAYEPHHMTRATLLQDVHQAEGSCHRVSSMAHFLPALCAWVCRWSRWPTSITVVMSGKGH